MNAEPQFESLKYAELRKHFEVIMEALNRYEAATDKLSKGRVFVEDNFKQSFAWLREHYHMPTEGACTPEQINTLFAIVQPDLQNLQIESSTHNTAIESIIQTNEARLNSLITESEDPADKRINTLEAFRRAFDSAQDPASKKNIIRVFTNNLTAHERIDSLINASSLNLENWPTLAELVLETGALSEGKQSSTLLRLIGKLVELQSEAGVTLLENRVEKLLVVAPEGVNYLLGKLVRNFRSDSMSLFCDLFIKHKAVLSQQKNYEETLKAFLRSGGATAEVQQAALDNLKEKPLDVAVIALPRLMSRSGKYGEAARQFASTYFEEILALPNEAYIKVFGVYLEKDPEGMQKLVEEKIDKVDFTGEVDFIIKIIVLFLKKNQIDAGLQIFSDLSEEQTEALIQRDQTANTNLTVLLFEHLASSKVRESAGPSGYGDHNYGGYGYNYGGKRKVKSSKGEIRAAIAAEMLQDERVLELLLKKDPNMLMRNLEYMCRKGQSQIAFSIMSEHSLTLLTANPTQFNQALSVRMPISYLKFGLGSLGKTFSPARWAKWSNAKAVINQLVQENTLRHLSASEKRKRARKLKKPSEYHGLSHGVVHDTVKSFKARSQDSDPAPEAVDQPAAASAES